VAVLFDVSHFSIVDSTMASMMNDTPKPAVVPFVLAAAVNPVVSSVCTPVVYATTEVEDVDADEADDFPAATGGMVVLDRESMDMIIAQGRSGPPSVATTALASAVGSVVGPPRDAFLRSITFYKDQETQMGWDLKLSNHTVAGRTFGRKKAKVMVESIEGIFCLSQIKEGDYLKSINQKNIGPSLNAERALERMHNCLREEGVLSVAVGNSEGDDILVQATIIKPRPDMTYKELGMIVWYWGYMCIKSIEKKSIFKHTVLRTTDHIVSINDISCEGVTPEGFAHIIGALPLEVTITVYRRKERGTGHFK
jgi:hypothetical protein